MQLQLLLQLVNNVSSAALVLQAVSQKIATAQAEGRDITAEELRALSVYDDKARQMLEDAIAEAEREGR